MSQVYETIQRPSVEKIEQSFDILQKWNKPVGEEKSVDVEWTDPLTQKKWQVRLPYWVKFAIDVQYVFPGYSLQDYFHGAINGFPADETDIKKAGFNLVAICNEMGQFKCLAGETMITTPKGFIPLRKLSVGDKILGSNGWGTVLKTIRSHRPVLRLKTSKGMIFSSPEHRFWTQFGWIECQFLNSNHRLLVPSICYGNSKTMDERREKSLKATFRGWMYPRTSFQSIRAISRRSMGDEIQVGGQESDLEVRVSSQKQTLAERTPGNRLSLSGWNSGWRRNDYDYDRSFFKISNSQTHPRRHQHITTLVRLDSTLHKSHIHKSDKNGRSNRYPWTQSRGVSESSPSISDYQTGTSHDAFEVLRISDGADNWFALHSDTDENLLGDSRIEHESAKVLGVERASEEERLYDLVTDIGQYVAEGILVHNSNLALQLSGQVYGEEKAGEWYPDWDTVLKHKILSREEIIPTWKQAKEMGGRIKLQLLDDIDSIFSKELWFEDRNLYIKLRKALNLIRPRLSNFIVTAPSLNDVISILNTKITFEVMPFPNKTYMVERYCRFVDQFSSTTNFFRKIMTEYSKFRAKDLPSDVYKQYDNARASKEEEEMGELEKAMEDSVNKDEKEEEKQEERNPWMQPRDPKTMSQVKILICEKCGYQWPSDKNPMACPKCHTRKIASKIFNLAPA